MTSSVRYRQAPVPLPSPLARYIRQTLKMEEGNFNENLILEVEKYRKLYDLKNKFYSNNHRQKEIWREIGESLQQQGMDVIGVHIYCAAMPIVYLVKNTDKANVKSEYSE